MVDSLTKRIRICKVNFRREAEERGKDAKEEKRKNIVPSRKYEGSIYCNT